MFPYISPCRLTRNVGTSDICVIMFSTNRYFRLVTKDGTDWRGRQLRAERGALSFIIPIICGIFLLVAAVWYVHLLPPTLSHTDFLLDMCVLGCHGSKWSSERDITIMPGTIYYDVCEDVRLLGTIILSFDKVGISLFLLFCFVFVLMIWCYS